ncbi:unnamed protein product [Lampetra planeri]
MSVCMTPARSSARRRTSELAVFWPVSNSPTHPPGEAPLVALLAGVLQAHIKAGHRSRHHNPFGLAWRTRQSPGPCAGRECSCPGSSNDGGSPRGSSTLSLKVVYSVDVLSLRLPPVQQLHQQQDVHHT